MKLSTIPSISIIVPCYKEVENLPLLVKEIENSFKNYQYIFELILVDDNSQDGTVEFIESLNLNWVNLIVRKKDKGLSQAVIEGLNHAKNDYLVVMDADLSHSPQVIPKMIETLDKGHDFVVGSRYVNGASTDETWGFYRWLNSKVATLLAYPFTKIKDPMSGFFALKKSTFKKKPPP